MKSELTAAAAEQDKSTAENGSAEEKAQAGGENSSAVTDAAPAEKDSPGRRDKGDVPDDEPYEKRKRPWTKDRVFALVLQIVIVLMIVGGIVFYRWYSNKNNEYKTGIMADGDLCIAYICNDSGSRESFILEGEAVEEQSRFAFSEFYYKRIGRIYRPAAEGTAVLDTVHIDRLGNEVHERIEITVDSSMNVTYTVETDEEEQSS